MVTPDETSLGLWVSLSSLARCSLHGNRICRAAVDSAGLHTGIVSAQQVTREHTKGPAPGSLATELVLALKQGL